MAWVMTAVREPGHGSGPPGRHRELFPLPLVESSFMRDHVCGKASRTVRLRVARREQRLSLCNKVISSLNLLYDGRGARHTITSTNVAQRESLSRLLQAVDAFGSPPQQISLATRPLGSFSLRRATMVNQPRWHRSVAQTLTPCLSQSTELFPELWENLEEIRVVTSLSVF